MNKLIASIFNTDYKIIYEGLSDFSEKIKVIDVNGTRELIVNSVVHTIKNSDRTNYWQIAVENAYVEDGFKILVLGLGGGEIPRRLNEKYKNLEIDCVEIDSKIIEVYNKYFYDKKQKNLHIYEEDAYTYVMKTKKKYNIIFSDVYFKGIYDENLNEDNFLDKCKKSLYPHGQFVANRIFAYSPKIGTREYEQLLKMYFKNVYYRYVGDHTIQTSNYVFFANK